MGRLTSPAAWPFRKMVEPRNLNSEMSTTVRPLSYRARIAILFGVKYQDRSPMRIG